MRPHPLITKLGLGTAQFGLDGAAPAKGRSPEAEVREILAIAGRAGVSVLDTGAASMHGEAVLGAIMPRPAPFKITVKAARGDKGPDFVEQESRASLRRLGLVRADSIMVQAASDLFAPYGKALWERLLQLRDAGLFERVGISAYASDDPAGLARRFGPDLMQAPASLLERIDRHARRLEAQQAGLRLYRSDAARMLLEKALNAEEGKEGERPGGPARTRRSKRHGS